MSYASSMRRAKADQRAGKSPSTQAGEFVREEFHHLRQGKHGARSPQQAIAIGLSKARRAGVDLPPPARGQSAKVRRQATRDYAKGQAESDAVDSRPAHKSRKAAGERTTPARASARTHELPGVELLAHKAVRARNTFAHQK